MYIKQKISKRLNEFKSICENHNIKTLYAFGSSTTNAFNDNTSDIDLLVEIDELNPIEKGEKIMSLWDNLEGFFAKKVDLLTANTIKNPYLIQSIENSKLLIYDGSSQKVFV